MTRSESTRELRAWISATLDELKRNLEELRAGADPAEIAPRVARSLSWSPVIDELIELLNDPAPGGAAADSPSGRVLVVEDSAGYRMLVARVLRMAGYEVDSAEDGARAWARLEERAFDVVVTDVEMPEMDGPELVRRLRASRRLRDLPVIVLTGLDDPPDPREERWERIDAFLCKFRPDTLSVLLDHLARMTGRRDGRD